MARIAILVAVSAAMAFFMAPAHAEVVTIEGTLASVDATARTITVEADGERKTLDVSRKVKVSVSGKTAALGTLKSGQSVKLSYHDALEIVLRIDAAGEVVRDQELTITLGSDGSCTVILKEPLDSPTPAVERSAEPSSKLDVFGGASVSKEHDGRVRLRYDFTEFTELEYFRPTNNEGKRAFDEQLSIVQDEGVLLMSPGASSRSVLAFPRRIIGQLTLSVTFRGFSEGLLIVQFNLGEEVLLITLTGDPTPEHDPNSLVVAFRDKNREFHRLLTSQRPGAVGSLHKCKIASYAPGTSSFVSIGHRGQLPVGLARLEITAKFAASFGMALGALGKRVVIDRAVVNSAAAEAGIRQGDVLVAVNGKDVADVDDALNTLGGCTPGEAVDVEIMRLGQKRTITVTPR